MCSVIGTIAIFSEMHSVDDYRRRNARRRIDTATIPSRTKEAVQRTPVIVGSAFWSAGSRGRSLACFVHSIADV